MQSLMVDFVNFSSAIVNFYYMKGDWRLDCIQFYLFQCTQYYGTQIYLNSLNFKLFRNCKATHTFWSW